MGREDMLPHGGNETASGGKRFSSDLDTVEGRLKQLRTVASGLFRDADEVIAQHFETLGMSAKEWVEREDATPVDVQRAIDALREYKRSMSPERNGPEL